MMQPYFLLLFLAAPAWAEDPPAQPTPAWMLWNFLRTDLSEALEVLEEPQEFHRAAHGFLDGSFDPDLVFLSTDGVTICFDVSIMKAAYVLQRAAKDALILGGAQGQAGRLLLAQADGIAILEVAHDIALQEVQVAEPEHGFTGGAFQRLDRLLAVDLNQDDELDVVGIGGPGNVLVALLADSAAPSGYVVHPTFGGTTNGNFLDACVADLGSGPEIFVASDTRLERFDLTGAPTSYTTQTTSRATVTSFKTDGVERVAWIYENSQGDDVLVVVGSGGPESPIHLGPLGVAWAAAGRVGEHQAESLLVSTGPGHELLMIWNRPESVGFDAEDITPFTQLEIENPWASLGQPILADLNLDGEADIAVASSLFQQALVKLSIGTFEDYSTLAPTPGYMDFFRPWQVKWLLPLGLGNETNNRIEYSFFAQGPIANEVIPAPDHLPYLTYRWNPTGFPQPDTEHIFPLFPPGMISTYHEYIIWIRVRYAQVDEEDPDVALSKGVPYTFALADPSNPLAAWFLKESAYFEESWIIDNPDIIGNGEKIPMGGSPPTPPPPGGPVPPGGGD